VIATGAAQISRRGVGTPVFAGMLAASSMGIFLVPMLYVTFQKLRERVKARFGKSSAKQFPSDVLRRRYDLRSTVLTTAIDQRIIRSNGYECE